jgi:hypothetical protein
MSDTAEWYLERIVVDHNIVAYTVSWQNFMEKQLSLFLIFRENVGGEWTFTLINETDSVLQWIHGQDRDNRAENLKIPVSND